MVAMVQASNDFFQVIDGDIDLCILNFPDILSVNFQPVCEFLLGQIVLNSHSFDPICDQSPKPMLTVIRQMEYVQLKILYP